MNQQLLFKPNWALICNNVKKPIKYFLIIVASLLFFTNCSNVNTKDASQKELELRKRELDLKEKELSLKEKELNTIDSNQKKEVVNKNSLASESSLNYLYNYDNKYPYAVHLYDRNPVKTRLENLLEDNYSLFRTNTQVESPIFVENHIVFSHGCKAHRCGTDNCIAAFDIQNDVIFVAIRSDTSLYIFTEDSNKEIPETIKEWAGHKNFDYGNGSKIVSD